MANIEITVYEHKQGPSLSEQGRYVAYPWVNGQIFWIRSYGQTEKEAHDKCMEFTKAELDRQKELDKSSKIDPETPTALARKPTIVTSKGTRGATKGSAFMAHNGLKERKRVEADEIDKHEAEGWFKVGTRTKLEWLTD